MSNFEFSDGTNRLLHEHPSLPAARTRELGGAFNTAQQGVCRCLADLAYPLERITQELEAGRVHYFREGTDRDRKGDAGNKASYRFAGFPPSLVKDFEQRVAERNAGVLTARAFAEWEAPFLMRFTFDVIEQVAERVVPVSGPVQPRARLAAALAAARALRDEILNGNLLLVAKMAIRREGFCLGCVLDDLFAAGTDGLLIAISRYDPMVGQFSTYATPWIKMAIERFAAKTRYVIRIPVGVQDKIRRERRADRSGASISRAAGVYLISEVQSLEDPAPGFDNGEVRLEDILADSKALRPSEGAEVADVAGILHDGLQDLDPLRRFVIALRNDIGDADVLAAQLFREEAALSLARGRAIADAVSKSLDLFSRIRHYLRGPRVNEMRQGLSPGSNGRNSNGCLAHVLPGASGVAPSGSWLTDRPLRSAGHPARRDSAVHSGHEDVASGW